ncbi:MAG: hypothetical protein HY332_19800, partial [Chloroflexi bacterium]|nr:hypothetical protein [Chloroflexota bacterium]
MSVFGPSAAPASTTRSSTRRSPSAPLRRRAVLAAGSAAASALAAGCALDWPPAAAAPSAHTPSPVLPAATPEPAPEPTATPEPPPVIPPGDTHFGVNEGFLAASFAHQLGARWTRWVVDWGEVFRSGPDDFNDFYVDYDTLRQTLRHGYQVMAVLRGTPEWAQTDPAHGVRSVPKGLDLPVDDPENTWARSVRSLAYHYAGRIDTWAIWNEVEIPATGPNAMYSTWAGTLEQYYRLVKLAWIAARSVNPNARIVLSPYSYHRDKEWLTRFLRVASRDPEAAANVYFFDVVGLNLYRNPHDIYDRKRGGVPWAAEASDRIGVDERLAQFGLQKPVWVTEMNAMPYDDPAVEGWDPVARRDGFRIALDEQASFVIQAYALGIAAGYETLFWQAMQDDPPPVPDELWGLVRYHEDPASDDPARIRPAYRAYQVATRYCSGAERVEFVTVDRPDPAGYRRYAPRYQWRIHHVAFQTGARRTGVLWSGAGAARVSLPRLGTSAQLVDKLGNEMPLEPVAGRWLVSLEAATRRFTLFGGDPPGYYYIGGSPQLLVEEGLPPDAPVSRLLL